VNEEIKSAKVRVISNDGEQIGIVTVQEAMTIAERDGFDLVEVSPNSNPPVCKIMDYGKYKYELSKKEKVVKKRQQIVHVKEIRLRPKIEEHDFDFKLKHARKFLEEGDKVKVTVTFRGREMARLNFGEELLKRFESELEDVAKVERTINIEGRNMVLLLTKK
jgi:translation initiation factor IF-3